MNIRAHRLELEHFWKINPECEIAIAPSEDKDGNKEIQLIITVIDAYQCSHVAAVISMHSGEALLKGVFLAAKGICLMVDQSPKEGNVEQIEERIIEAVVSASPEHRSPPANKKG